MEYAIKRYGQHRDRCDPHVRLFEGLSPSIALVRFPLISHDILHFCFSPVDVSDYLR
jgi:hypothetical protein